MAEPQTLPSVQLAPDGSLLNEACFKVAQLLIKHNYEEATNIIAKFSAFKKELLHQQAKVEREKRKALEEEKLVLQERTKADAMAKEKIEKQIELLRLRESLGVTPENSGFDMFNTENGYSNDNYYQASGDNSADSSYMDQDSGSGYYRF
ncbi:hypothetical protein FA13DRAFT_1800055 [Coprinellus micaceus]|uniref:Uncharacterized protein n=1 Tax=Coprinellus micaceus TaxID=71717 RepID=A0A4Y7SHH8_COPMI|nr:hypothetical protein FA13DRAFT_1800055 [Coprinellus micaceus]